MCHSHVPYYACVSRWTALLRHTKSLALRAHIQDANHTIRRIRYNFLWLHRHYKVPFPLIYHQSETCRYLLYQNVVKPSPNISSQSSPPVQSRVQVLHLPIVLLDRCKTWTLDSRLDSQTGLTDWTVDWYLDCVLDGRRVR